MAIAAAIYPKLPYHPTRSFIPLTMIASFPLILVVPANDPAKTVKDLVAWAKANPDKSNYADLLAGLHHRHRAVEAQDRHAGVAMPFKSSNEMILCVVSEQCLFAIADGPPAVPLVKGGKIRALAVTGAERSPELPDVPSMAEAGYPEVNTPSGSGLFVPADTPAPIVKKLTKELGGAMADPGVQEGPGPWR